MNKKLLLILLLAGATILGVTALLILRNREAAPSSITTGIRIYISPLKAEVTANETAVPSKKFKGLELAPGKYTIIARYHNFEEFNESITVEAGKVTNVLIKLEPQTEDAKTLLLDPEERLAREEVAGYINQRDSEVMLEKYPITSKLPLITANWRIDYGVSLSEPNNSQKTALYVTTYNDADRQLALQWISLQGYSPADYEIVYQYFE